MSLWCAHAIVGDPPSLRRSHEIYSTYGGVPSATRCGIRAPVELVGGSVEHRRGNGPGINIQNQFISRMG